MNVIPLARAMLCLNDDTIWCVDDVAVCPSCGSEHGMPLAAWLAAVESGGVA